MTKFKIRYSPLFYEDLDKITDYILLELKDESAAKSLINNVEKTINKYLNNPLSVAPYKSIGSRSDAYRKIRVGNYLIFFVVIENTMIVRRMLYGRRDLDRIL
jgi:toxin ParE1/3/4